MKYDFFGLLLIVCVIQILVTEYKLSKTCNINTCTWELIEKDTQQMTDKEKQMHADILMLREALGNAVEMVAEWGSYASKHFQEKWNLQGDIDELQEALSATEHYKGK